MLFKFNRLILIPFLMFVNLRCSNKSLSNNQAPIPQEKFSKLIADFLLAESAVNLNIKNLNINAFDSAYAFNPLKDNNISKSLYDSTILFYSSHPDLYKEMYEEALQLLSEMQTAQRTIIMQDSLRAIQLKKDSIEKHAK